MTSLWQIRISPEATQLLPIPNYCKSPLPSGNPTRAACILLSPLLVTLARAEHDGCFSGRLVHAPSEKDACRVTATKSKPILAKKKKLTRTNWGRRRVGRSSMRACPVMRRSKLPLSITQACVRARARLRGLAKKGDVKDSSPSLAIGADLFLTRGRSVSGFRPQQFGAQASSS